jgi:isobutyryl-CoA mutase
VLIPGARVRYLAEIAEQGRAINRASKRRPRTADRAQSYWQSLRELEDPAARSAGFTPDDLPAKEAPADAGRLRKAAAPASERCSCSPCASATTTPCSRSAAKPQAAARMAGAAEVDHRRGHEYQVRGKTIRVENYRESLSHQKIPKIAAPTYKSWGELLTFLRQGEPARHYPYTGGVYPYRRTGEDPIRMFAGEGTPERTNRRFHYLSSGQPAARLSTAFDSVTLYGEDPAERPDIYGKIGNSGVNIATLDDMKKLYSGFDLCAPTTSVSMTINGPAPIILAMFMNTAIDQQVEKYLRADDARWDEAQRRSTRFFEGRTRPEYAANCRGQRRPRPGPARHHRRPAGRRRHLRAHQGRDAGHRARHRAGRHPQGGPGAEHLHLQHRVRAAHDGRHPAVLRRPQGAQLLLGVDLRLPHRRGRGEPDQPARLHAVNGFTIVEYYLARGMKIDDFAPNLSFFFSNGMDPEYTVIGRVARRIWARAMRERYGANERSQMMKYHIQTSGRSLHAQEIQFNDIRTTLQALYALFDNCNSLHTNAYDEAITTPTEESVRRAVAIQMIINKELGLNFCENPWQGSFIVDKLTDLVEEAVYKEFEAISERGGVLGAMDTMYQRGKIQEESLYYEHKKHDGSLPLIGVNTFLPKEHAGEIVTEIELIRSTPRKRASRSARAALAGARRCARYPAGSPAGRRRRGLDRIQAAGAGERPQPGARPGRHPGACPSAPARSRSHRVARLFRFVRSIGSLR